MFLITIKLDWVSFETKRRQNLQKSADFVIESMVFWLYRYVTRMNVPFFDH